MGVMNESPQHGFSKVRFYWRCASVSGIFPTPNPAPRGGECYRVTFFEGVRPQKTSQTGFPLPPGKGVRGMGLPTKPAKELRKAVLVDFGKALA